MTDTNTIVSKRQALRVQSVDILRGAVMVLMAIDHVRVYSGLPAGGATPGIFFTRWVTNFCAPAFVFFAGTSAFLYGIKLNNNGKLARFLVLRGLMLVALELTVIRFFWMFNFNYTNLTLAGVIWMLGWCMVLLAAFVRLRPAVVGTIGLAIILFRPAFRYVPLALPEGWRNAFGSFWEFFYPSGFNGPNHIAILFVLIPWVGVMMAGYGFGTVLMREPSAVKRFCLRVGISAIIIFLIAGTLVILFGPAYQGNLPVVFRLLAQQKYPPSQLFLLMTLGPLIALVPFAQRAKGKVADIFKTFGRVPLFYYMLHILLIHISALIVNFIREGAVHQERYTTAPFTEIDEGQRWTLPLLYLVFVIDVTLLYFVCRWYAKYKSAHPEKKWLKYI